MSYLLQLDGAAAFRGPLTMIFALLSVLLILFVLFRQTDSQGLAGGAFGGAVGGEGAFGAKGQKVADKVIAWMCGLFLVLSLLIAWTASTRIAMAPVDKQTESGDNK